MNIEQYEPKESGEGYIHYVHESTGRIRQLDPHLDATMEQIATKLNYIRYTTYRIAAKLEMLSHELFRKKFRFVFKMLSYCNILDLQ